MAYFFDDVTDWLSVGGDLDLARDLTGQSHVATVESLREHGITHVLDVRAEWHDRPTWVAAGLDADNYCYAPIVDSHRHRPSDEWYETVVDFVEGFWLDSSEGDRLYVHCHMGINRAPSAAMLSLLTVDPTMDPFAAFMAIRNARPAAGLIYAESVGIWHLLRSEGVELREGDYLPLSVVEFSTAMNDYWTPERIREVNRGIAYYRSAEGGTLVVKG